MGDHRGYPQKRMSLRKGLASEPRPPPASIPKHAENMRVFLVLPPLFTPARNTCDPKAWQKSRAGRALMGSGLPRQAALLRRILPVRIARISCKAGAASAARSSDATGSSRSIVARARRAATQMMPVHRKKTQAVRAAVRMARGAPATRAGQAGTGTWQPQLPNVPRDLDPKHDKPGAGLGRVQGTRADACGRQHCARPRPAQCRLRTLRTCGFSTKRVVTRRKNSRRG